MSDQESKITATIINDYLQSLEKIIATKNPAELLQEFQTLPNITLNNSAQLTNLCNGFIGILQQNVSSSNESGAGKIVSSILQTINTKPQDTGHAE